MATGQVHTMNLSDDGEGMVPLHDNPSTAFMQNGDEKNMSQSKETTMDSTPINDIMMDPPMMNDEPRMQGMMPQMTSPTREEEPPQPHR
jgi:hypothetical protein